MTRSIARQIEDGEQKSPPERRPKQLELALALTPEKMRAHGLRAAHPRPLVSAGKTADDAPKSWRVPPAKAWRWPAVQYADAGASFAAIALDCDEPQKLAAGLWELPPPSWTIRRRRNENAHVVWCLEEPVHKHRSAKIGPLLYLANTAEYYAQKMRGRPRIFRDTSAQPSATLPIGRIRNDLGQRSALQPGRTGKRNPVRMERAESPPDRDRPELRSVQIADGVGRPPRTRRAASPGSSARGERRVQRAPAGERDRRNRSISRALPEAVGGARMERAKVDRAPGSARASSEGQDEGRQPAPQRLDRKDERDASAVGRRRNITPDVVPPPKRGRQRRQRSSSEAVGSRRSIAGDLVPPPGSAKGRNGRRADAPDP